MEDGVIEKDKLFELEELELVPLVTSEIKIWGVDIGSENFAAKVTELVLLTTKLLIPSDSEEEKVSRRGFTLSMVKVILSEPE